MIWQEKRTVVLIGVLLAASAVALWLRPSPAPVSTGPIPEGYSPFEGALFIAMSVVTYFWFFMLGACIGSFVNVAAQRSSLGLSLTRIGSRCPKCETPILLGDNLPIVGWLRLSGRCRACSAPIAIRYLIVEVMMGTVFLALALSILDTGGRFLPVRPPNIHAGVVWIVWYTKWDLMRIYLLHCFLMSALAIWALMEFDRCQPSFVRFGLIASSVVIFAWIYPDVLPAPAARFDLSPRLSAPLTSAIGLTVGGFLGLTISRFDSANRLTAVAAFGLFGACVGWQTTVVFAVLATIVLAAVRRLAYRTVGPATVLFGVSAFLLPFWNRVPLIAWLTSAPLGAG